VLQLYPGFRYAPPPGYSQPLPAGGETHARTFPRSLNANQRFKCHQWRVGKSGGRLERNNAQKMNFRAEKAN